LFAKDTKRGDRNSRQEATIPIKHLGAREAILVAHFARSFSGNTTRAATATDTLREVQERRAMTARLAQTSFG
jgi:hypothetical protein